MDHDKPLISVVIPVYNAEHYILKALRSVCEQTYQNLQIIVIDDGSTDHSKDVIESVHDPRIELISRENRGLIATLNEGVQRSDGEYIARMDADDICFPDRFARQQLYFEAHAGFGVLFTGLEYIDASGKVMRKKVAHENREIKPVELLFGCPVCHPTAMFNMNVLAKPDIRYDSEFDKTEDFELWTRLASKTKIGILSEVLFQYRIHSESITSKNNAEQRETALKAIMKNLSHLDSEKVTRAIGTLYNNHQGQYSALTTLLAALRLFFQLSRINRTFSHYKFLTKSYYVLRDQFSKKDGKTLRDNV
ncbi:glycosyltransferase [Paraglaciecola mesophila]|uniref:Glycosyltransferase n=1 Tax=Paraglaciecola mesophila TaxID=197222 RepID=A0ABU9SXG4_9ALTE